MYFQWTLKINIHFYLLGYIFLTSHLHYKLEFTYFCSKFEISSRMFWFVGRMEEVHKSINLILSKFLLINFKLLWKKLAASLNPYRENKCENWRGENLSKKYIKNFFKFTTEGCKTCLISFSSRVSTKAKKEKQSGNLMQYFEIFSY